jgi:uncharacterized tellurite resistance protein B-like protein
MKPQGIRFTPETWALVQQMADLLHVSASQFVREAALARAIYVGLMRGHPATELYGQLSELVEDISSEDRVSLMRGAVQAAREASHDHVS